MTDAYVASLSRTILRLAIAAQKGVITQLTDARTGNQGATREAFSRLLSDARRLLDDMMDLYNELGARERYAKERASVEESRP